MTRTYRPTGYMRKVLMSDERVILITRRHWLVLLVKIFWWVVLFVLLAGSAVWFWLNRVADQTWLWLAIGSLVPLGGWIWEHLVWKSQMNVMTDRRVLQMQGVLNKDVSDSLLEKLNDVKTEQSLLGRIFGYGDVTLLTASEQGASFLRTIADPLGFKRSMLAAKEALDDGRPRNPGPR